MKYYYRLISTILMLSMSFAQLASSQDKSNFSWGVVYSSDQNIDEAKKEIDQLPRLLPQYRNQNSLFKRRNWYSSVVLFENESDAKNFLPIIQNKYSRGSFVVNLQNWCRPKWNEYTGISNGVNYYDCKRGEIITDKQGKIINPGAIVTNTFSNLKAAKADLETLKKTFPTQQHNLTIFKRGDSFHTAVINYANQKDAEKNIPNGKKFYTVDIKDWCKPSGNLTKDDYIQCQNK